MSPYTLLIKLLLFSTAFIITPSHSNSQSLAVGFEIGLGEYSMQGLKEINRYMVRTTPFRDKIVHNYPDYYYYKPELLFVYKRVNMGLSYLLQSTGSRISGKDYSGEYRFDSMMKSTGLNLTGGIRLFPQYQTFWGVFIYSDAGYMKSVLKFDEHLDIFESEVINHQESYFSTNYFIEPGVKVAFSYSLFTFQLSYGYLNQFGDNNLTSQNTNRELSLWLPKKPEWNGYRYGASLYFVLPLRKNKNSKV